MVYYLRCISDVCKKLNRILTREQKKYSFGMIALTIMGAFFETLGVSIIIPLVSAMVSPEELLDKNGVKIIVNMFGITTSTQLIWLMGVSVIIVYVIKNAYMTGLSYYRAKYASKVQRELSVRLMQSYMLREYNFFLNINTSDLLRAMNTDVTGVYQVLYLGFRLIAEGITIAGIFAFIMITDVSFSLSVILLTGILLVGMLLLFKNKMKQLGNSYRDCSREVSKFQHEAFQGIKEIIVSQRREYFSDHYENAYINMQRANVGQVVASESPAYLIEGICVSGLILVVCIKVLGASGSTAFIPQLAAFAVAAFRILPSLGRISSSFNQVVYYCPSLNATYKNLEEIDAYHESNNYSIKAVNRDRRKEENYFQTAIEIRNVCWRYNACQEDILHNLNMQVEKGQSVAIIGMSGAGKSTLADVLLGLLRPQSGEILVDGVSIFENEKAWHHMIGYVPQSVYLLDDTIRNNVAFGIEECDIEDARILVALKQAQLEEYVAKLPSGLDTIVGERGIRFSGGQRQRLALARALYNDPEILILDEATAALDTETETAVMESIEKLQGKKTLIIIAHRLTTIRKCDAIYEIVNGKANRRRKEDILI